MNDCLAYQRQIFMIACGVAVAALVTLFIVFPNNLSYAYGLILGFAGGVIWYRGQVSAIHRFLQDPENTSPKIAVRASLQGYAVMIIAVLIAKAYSDTFNMWSTFGGLLIPRLILQIDGFVRPAHLAPQTTETPEDSQ